MKKYTLIRHIIELILVLILSFSTSFAWFAKSNHIDPKLSDATIIKQYFHCGSGSDKDPFVVTRPVHYYNLVQLFQRTSGFAVNGDSSTAYYFQLGYELDSSSEGLEFFNYDDDGNQITTSGNMYSKELNLEFYKGENALLPIGTSDIPFNDVFDGKGLTVKNLHIKATQTVGEETFGTADIGIFGYVTSEATIKNVYYTDFDIDLTDTDPTRTVSGHDQSVHDFNKDNTPDLVYVGYIAGHVSQTSQISHVYINNCKIIGGNASKSNFGYFGYVDSSSDVEVPALGDLIANLHTFGNEAGFGGSIRMKDILERLVAIASTSVSSTVTTYGNIETITINERDNSEVHSIVSTKNITYIDTNEYNSSAYRYYKHSDYDGQYYFIDELSGRNRYEGIFGSNSLNKKSILTFTYKNNDLNAWYIKNGNTYLSVNNLALASASTEDQAVKWVYEANNDGTYYICGYLETYTNDTTVKYYLNRSGNYGLTISNTASTKWNLTNADTSDSFTSKLYTVVNGENRYIEYDTNSSTWKLVPYLSYYVIKQGNNNYLSNNNTNITNATSEANALRLIPSTGTLSNNSQVTFYTILNDEKRYLTYDGSLKLSNSATTFDYNANELSISYAKEGIPSVKYVLGLDGTTWNMYITSGKILNDGNNHYLAVSNGAISSSNQANAPLWQFSNSSGDTYIYIVIDGAIKFLSYSTNKGLYLDDDAFEWKRSGNSFYFTSGNIDYYLNYNNAWGVKEVGYLTISFGTSYLQVPSNNNFSVTTQANATHFYSSGISEAASSGTLYCKIGGTDYYLYNNNGTLATSTTSQTTWTYDANGKLGNNDYYLDLIDNTWVLSNLINTKVYYYLSNGTYYLSSSGTTVERQSNITNATKWVFSNDNGNSSSGTIRNAATTNNYLVYSSDLKLATTSNSWTNNSRKLYTGNRYLRYYSNNWTTTTNKNNGTTLTFERHELDVSIVEATLPNINVNDTNKSYSINLTNKTVGSDETFTSTSQQEFEKSYKANINGSYDTYFPIKLADEEDGEWYDTSDPYKVSLRNTGYIIGGARLYDTEPNTSTFQTGFGDIRISYFPRYNIASSTLLKISLNGNYLTINNNQSGITRTTNAEEATDWEFTYIKKTTSGNTTVIQYYIGATVNNTKYYLLGTNGALNLENTNSPTTTWNLNTSNYTLYYTGGTWTTTNYYIRYYNNAWTCSNTNSNNQLSITFSALTNIYTINGNGIDQAVTETEAYIEAKSQLLDTLKGTDSVYGLHFMNAQISKDYLVTAPKAAILGKEYDNYEMPQDSINFNVIQRGSINFFAGNYFTKNDTFFSLHKVFRDGNNKITDIMEIIEVYEKTNANQNYIYKLKDSSGNFKYTNADGSYSGATSLNAEYNSTPIFKTSWITNPGISEGSNLYYFEVPCNAGEYCLGSVSGKTGAYLVYLDIASNGGEAISNIISADGNTLTTAFREVEYRDSPMKVEDGEHSILQVGVNVPSGATNANFSIEVSFDSSQTGPSNEYENGLYTIKIANTSGGDVVIDVFICDNNSNLYDAFPYAYQIIYTNESHQTETKIHTLITDKEYFQSMGSFTIPSLGDAVESSYSG